MYDLLTPRLRHVLSRPESAGDVGWFQLPGLFLQLYESSEPGRETTGWITVAASRDGLAKARRICLGCFTQGFSSLDRDDPAFDLVEDNHRSTLELQLALYAVNPVWISRAEEINDAASLVITNYIDPTSTPEKRGEARRRLECLGVIDGEG